MSTLSVPAAAAAARAAPPLLHAAGLAVRRGGRTLFERLDLALEPGAVVWLRGRNGRGKTSLLRLLAGVSSPDAGDILLAWPAASDDASAARAVDAAPSAVTPRALGPGWRRGLVYVGHQNALKDDLTATEALRFLARLRGASPAPDAIAAALQRLGVRGSRNAPVRTLSQGQRRRVSLARLALAIDAPLWLLDEPFDALDVDGIDALNALLAEHAARGGATLMTSHQTPTLADPVPRVLDLDGHVAA